MKNTDTMNSTVSTCIKRIKNELNYLNKAYKLNAELKDYVKDVLKDITEKNGLLFYKDEPGLMNYSDEKKEDERLKKEQELYHKWFKKNEKKIKNNYIIHCIEYPKNTDDYRDSRNIIELSVLGKSYDFYIESCNYHGWSNAYIDVEILLNRTNEYDGKAIYRFEIDTKEVDEDKIGVRVDPLCKCKLKFHEIYEDFNSFIKGYELFLSMVNEKNNIVPFFK